jgi:hypothetical protein
MEASQQILLLSSGPEGTRGLAEANDLLRQGWRVAQVCPMGGGGAAEGFAAALVLERSGDRAESVLERIEEEMEETGDGASALGLDLPPEPPLPGPAGESPPPSGPTGA